MDHKQNLSDHSMEETSINCTARTRNARHTASQSPSRLLVQILVELNALAEAVIKDHQFSPRLSYRPEMHTGNKMLYKTLYSETFCEDSLMI
jgi:hypothetical protein